jgi:hypothetical protein
MKWRIPARWEMQRVWRLAVFVGSFLVPVYFGLNEIHGENSLAAWLVVIGAIAICVAWSNVARARSGRPLMASFVLCGCPIVDKTAIPTSGAARMADSATRFWDLMALSRDQKKLFPHFGEAGTAVFAVEEVEDGGHDRTPSFDHHHAIICSGCKT